MSFVEFLLIGDGEVLPEPPFEAEVGHVGVDE